MSERDYYPAGAYDDPNAPYNQPDPNEYEVEYIARYSKEDPETGDIEPFEQQLKDTFQSCYLKSDEGLDEDIYEQVRDKVEEDRPEGYELDDFEILSIK